jgi:hypothetical protein
VNLDEDIEEQRRGLTEALFGVLAFPGGSAVPFALGVGPELHLELEVGGRGATHVVAFFEHTDLPGVRIAHRFPRPEVPSDLPLDLELKVFIETGGLLRSHAQMDGTVWTSISADVGSQDVPNASDFG